MQKGNHIEPRSRNSAANVGLSLVEEEVANCPMIFQVIKTLILCYFHEDIVLIRKRKPVYCQIINLYINVHTINTE